MNLAVLFWSEAAEFSENADEIALGAELKVVRDIADGIFGERKKVFCGIDTLFLNVLGDCDSYLRMEKL